MASLALIGMGSNLGDRASHLDVAVAALAKIPGVSFQAVSRYRETPPVGGPSGQHPFLNAAAALETALDPLSLLEQLHAIEHEAGRVRTVRWGERTLDLDLLLFGGQILDTGTLRLPHPRMALRRFVLAPLNEIAPEAIDPITGRSVRDLLANLDRRPSYLAFASGSCLDLIEKNPLDFELMDMSRVFGEEPPSLYSRLKGAIHAVDVAGCWEGPGLGGVESSAGFSASRDLSSAQQVTALIALRLSVDALAACVPTETWLVSPFWFDTMFLALDSLKASRPRFPRYREAFLELRSSVLPPTFVVARPKDRQRYGIQDPRYDWFRPIGWDAPVLEVSDNDPEAALSQIIDACAATRAG